MRPLHILVLACVFSAIGCSDNPAPPAGTGPSATWSGPSALAKKTSSPAPATSSTAVGNHRTESAPIAIQNLGSQIAGSERAFNARPDDINAREALLSLISLRFQTLGNAADLDRVAALAEEAVTISTTDPHPYVVRARGRAAAHRFAEALQDLDFADALLKKPGADTSVRETSSYTRTNILVSLGRYDDVSATIEAAAKSNPTMQTLSDYAVLLGKMGRLQEAESAFVQAEQHFRGVSPFGLVALYFDRGLMWERAGNLELATAVYKAAIQKLPFYVHVAVHLAPLLPPSEGVALLQSLADRTDSPDVFNILGVLQNLITKHGGDASLNKATDLYRARYDAHPTAYADHAGWFWLGPGQDPSRALVAAKLNLSVRSTAEAYELMLAAAEAASDSEALCIAARDARLMKYTSMRLAERVRLLEAQNACVNVAVPSPAPSTSTTASAGPPPSR